MRLVDAIERELDRPFTTDERVRVQRVVQSLAFEFLDWCPVCGGDGRLGFGELAVACGTCKGQGIL